jgi:hypothetical protein
MNRRQKRVLLVVLLLASAGAVGHGARLVQRQHRELAAAQREADALAQQLAALKRDRIALSRELEAAQQQLAALPEPPAETSAAPAEGTLPEVSRWVAQTKKLQGLFHTRPGEAIPELALLREADWLLLARRADFGSEGKQRIALAEARSEAKRKFGALLLGAVRKHVAARQKEPPSDVFALLPYFDAPVERTLLERYEIVMRPGPPDLDTGAPTREPWRIWEKQPIDRAHDLRLTVVSTGTVSVARSW